MLKFNASTVFYLVPGWYDHFHKSHGQPETSNSCKVVTRQGRSRHFSIVLCIHSDLPVSQPGARWLICDCQVVTISLSQELWTWTKDKRMLPISLFSITSTVKCRPHYPQQSCFLTCGVSQMQSERTPKYAMNISHKMFHFNVPLHVLAFIYTHMCIYKERILMH